MEVSLNFHCALVILPHHKFRSWVSHSWNVFRHFFPSFVMRVPYHWNTLLLTVTLSVVITNPDDPQFDLEKLVAKWEKETQ